MRHLSIFTSIFMMALLFGCGGGSSSSGTASSSSTSSGVISDPYVVNAMFDELDSDLVVIQSTTAPSSMTGEFEFPDALTVGNTIRMRTTTGVMHATPGGVLTAYEGPVLTRRVSQDLVDAVAGGGEVIVTPLTTLAEQLQTAADAADEPLTEAEAIANIVNMIGDPSVTAEDLFNDPMEAFETGGDNDPALLRASMAVNIALEEGVASEGFDAALEAAQDLIDAIIPAELPEDPESIFIAANAIVEVVAGSDNPATAIDEFDDAEIDAVVAAAGDLEGDEVLVVDEDGGVDTFSYQDTFDTELATAKTSLATAMNSDLGTDLLTAANDLTQAKVTLDLATTAGTPVTISQADSDFLNFFYALTRVVLLADPLGGGTDPANLESLGDILDQLNVPENSATFDRYDLSNIELEDANGDPILPKAELTTTALKRFVYVQVGTALGDALIALDAVSADFDYDETIDGVNTNFDHSDVLFVKAAANGALFQGSFLQGINLQVDDETTIRDLIVSDTADTLTPDDLLANDAVLTVNDAAALAAAKTYGIAAANGLKAAIAAVEAEANDQENEFISLYDETAEDIAGTNADLDTAIDLLSGSTTFTDDDITVDLTQFFAGAINLRALLPDMTGENPGMFPDPTLGGMLSGDGIDLNADEFSDGIPDIIQGGLIGFTDSMLFGRAFEVQWSDPEWHQEAIVFAENGNGFTDLSGNPLGTWAIAADGSSLELTFDEDGSTITFTWAEGWSDDGWLTFESEMDGGVQNVMINELREVLDLNNLLSDSYWPHSVTTEFDPAISVEVAGATYYINDITVDLNFNGSTGGTYQAILKSDGTTITTDNGTWELDTQNLNPGALILTPDPTGLLAVQAGISHINYAVDPAYIAEWDVVRAMVVEVSIYGTNNSVLEEYDPQVVFWR